MQQVLLDLPSLFRTIWRQDIYEYPPFRRYEYVPHPRTWWLALRRWCRRRSAHQAIRQSQFSNNVPDIHTPPTARLLTS